MDKKQIKRALQTHVNGASVISCNQLETFLGIGHKKALELLNGMERLNINGSKKYFIPDVAERLMEKVVR